MAQQDDNLPFSMHGIPMTEEGFEHLVSSESPYRYELIDGVAYDMTGSTPQHSAIAANVSDIFRVDEIYEGVFI